MADPRPNRRSRQPTERQPTIPFRNRLACATYSPHARTVGSPFSERNLAMFTRLLAAGLAIATLGTAMPALAQSPQDDARFNAAQARFDREYQIYRQEAERYQASRRGGYNGGYDNGGYRQAPPAGYDNGGYPDDRVEQGYDPARYYRSGSTYQERTLSTDDRVYAGTDGRYYCKRSDGTTGLIIGAAGGGILGNVIDGGHSRTVGTLLGAAVGGLAGRAIDQNNSQVRCR